jgi:hypothetical protein
LTYLYYRQISSCKATHYVKQDNLFYYISLNVNHIEKRNVSCFWNCDTASFGTWIPTFRDEAVVSKRREPSIQWQDNSVLEEDTITSSRNFGTRYPVTQLHSRKTDNLTPEDSTTTSSWNIWNKVPNNAALQPKATDNSTLEDGPTTSSQNVERQVSRGPEPHPTKMETSTTPLRKPKQQWDLKFLPQWLRRLWSSDMWHHAVWYIPTFHRKLIPLSPATLMREAASSSEKSVLYKQTTPSYISQDRIVYTRNNSSSFRAVTCVQNTTTLLCVRFTHVQRNLNKENGSQTVAWGTCLDFNQSAFPVQERRAQLLLCIAMKITEVRASKNTAGKGDEHPWDSSGPSPTFMMKAQDKKCFNIYKAWTNREQTRSWETSG